MPPRPRKNASSPTDAKDPNSRPRGNHGQFIRALSTAERDAEAARLKEQNFTFQEIATELGFANKSGACRAVQRALKASVVPAANALRLREFARLELLWESLEPGIEAGDIKAITEARKVSESLRRLFDIDGAVEATDADETERTAIDQLLSEVNAWNEAEQKKIYGGANADG